MLIRVRHGTTPRDLAWDLSRGVFGTTIEVHRLLVRRLLSVAGDPPGSVGRAAASPVAMSFVRAVSVEKGETVPNFNADVAPGGVG